jgi:hypothetical protein
MNDNSSSIAGELAPGLDEFEAIVPRSSMPSRRELDIISGE